MAPANRNPQPRHAAAHAPTWLLTALLTLAMLCAVIATATGEYSLAVSVGFPPALAACVPGALDVYVVCALNVRRDVTPAVAAMIAVNAASHLLTAHVITASVPLIICTAAIAPLVLWRVHILGGHNTTDAPDQAPDAPPTPDDATPSTTDAVLEDTVEIPAVTAAPADTADADSAETVVRRLYAVTGRRPTTAEMQAALTAAGHPASAATARTLRLRIERDASRPAA